MTATILGRLILFLVLMVLPVFHPAVQQFSNAIFWIQSFVLVPVVVFLAWYSQKYNRSGLRQGSERNNQQQFAMAHRGRFRQQLFCHFGAVILPFILLPYLEFGRPFLELFVVLQFVYWSTILLQAHRWTKILYIDLLYFLFVVYRLINIESNNLSFNVLALGLIFIGFLVYALLLYRLEFGSGRAKSSETILSFAIPISIALLVVFLLPDGFLQDLRSLNNLGNIIEPQPLLGENNASENSNSARPEVFTLSPNSWPGNREQNGEGASGRAQNQYLVMVVQSPVETLYLADKYYTELDSTLGFTADPAFNLNQLTSAAYLETWQNPNPLRFRSQEQVAIDVYSTIFDKVTAYHPQAIEPTVFDRQYYPLSYSYRAASLVSQTSITQNYPQVSELSSIDLAETSSYLEVDVQNEKLFQDMLDDILPENASYIERIQAILQHFENYQYELGFTDNVSIEAVGNFLFNTYTGDCTEFSNSAALLGRLAGIPSRVVTGYLLSKGLQSPAHQRALIEIQSHFPPLFGKDPNSLYLLTTSHRHSWAQFYLPSHGWVDIETTSFAIPPTGNLNPNNMDIVIPNFEELEDFQPFFIFPWGIVLSLTMLIVTLAVIILYSYRWGRIIHLAIIARKNNELGYKSLYRLLLIRLKFRGYTLKNIDETPKEFAQNYPELETFVQSYTELLYSNSGKPSDLRKEYQYLLARQSGKEMTVFRKFIVTLKEIFLWGDMRYL